MSSKVLVAAVDVCADRLEVTVHAHDIAASEPLPIICTVATPRQSAMTGVYMGEELRARSSRPGAYDAMALPSLFNGHKRDPLATKVPTPCKPVPEAPLSSLAVTSLPAPPKRKKEGPSREFPTVRRAEKLAYQPRPWSAPAKVIEHLQAVGGFISHVDVSRQFNVTRNAITATFKPALQRGALVRQVVDGYVGFSLPGWEPEVDLTAQPQPGTQLNVIHASGAVDAISPDSGNRRFWPIELHDISPVTAEEATGLKAFLGTVSDALHRSAGQGNAADDSAIDTDFDPEQLSALYALSLREAELGMLLGYVAILQLRRQLFHVTRALPLSPLTEPPRLSDAA